MGSDDRRGEQGTLTLGTLEGPGRVRRSSSVTPGEPRRVSLETIATLPARGRERYERRAEVARGGLGRIVAAYNRELGREVALKELLHRDADAEARFVREARITAVLEHPGVVPIYDAGRWKDDGAPFYEMKLVRGRSLKERIADAGTLDERLALLPHVLAVAETIGYAHARGVIHRDLKPANVIVGDFGETVVIDWGLAKEIGTPEPEAATLAPVLGPGGELTVAGQVVGTPAYMPPEQAHGEEVDARADVYALGAILYHLLSGTRPFPGHAAAEVLALVRRVAPPPLTAGAPGVRAELAAIVDKAMSRDPDARYATAQEVVQELRRYQSGQLVRAHAYTRWERVRRAIWQQRGRLAYAAAGGALVVAMIVVGSRLDSPSISCALDPGELAGVWDEPARQGLRQSFAAVGRSDTFERAAALFDDYTGEWRAAKLDACRATHERGEQSGELLDRRTRCLGQLEQELRERVDVLRRGDPQVMARAVDVVLAQSPVSTCADVGALLGAPPRPADPAVRARLDVLDGELGALRARLDVDAPSLLRERSARAVEQARALAHSPTVARALAIHGWILARIGASREARMTLLEAIAAADEARDDYLRAETWVELFYYLQALEHDGEAAHQVIEMARAAIARAGDPPRLLSGFASRLSGRLLDDGDAAAAELHARQALRLAREAEVPVRELDALNGLGVALRHQDRAVEALAVAEEHLALSRRVYGSEAHAEVEFALDSRAQSLRMLYRYEEAERNYRRALELRRSVAGDVHARVADLHHNLSNVLRQQGKNGEALDAAQRALQIREQLYPAGHQRIGFSHRIVALCQLATGQPAEALASIDRALAMTGPALGETHPRFVRELYWKGRILGALGRHADAAAVLARARAADAEDASVAAALARALAEVGKTGAAREMLVAASALANEPEDHEVQAALRVAEAAIEWRGGDHDRARQAARAALAALDRSPSPLPNERAEIEAWLAAH